MKFSPDDPKLTAYALGELPADEAKELELALKGSAELRAAVEEIRQTASLLTSEFAAEPVTNLSSTQKDEVVANIPSEKIIPLQNRSFWRTAGLGAIAASILAVITWQVAPPPREETQLSMAPQVAKQQVVVSPAPQPADRAGTASGKVVPGSGSESLEDSVATLRIEPEMKLHLLPQIPAEALAQVEESASAKVLTRKDERQTRTATLNYTDRQIAALSKTDSNGAASYDDKFVTPPPVEKLPLVAVAPPPQQPAAEASPQKAKEVSLGVAGRNVPYGLEIPSGAVSARTRATTGTVAADRTTPQETRANKFVGRYGYIQSEPGESTPNESLHWNENKTLSSRELHSFYAESDYKKSYDGETARYPKYAENEFETVESNPLSTFSIDVDTASYANVRRFLNEGRMPPNDAVRIEEMINYFSYDYPQPKGDEPFSVNMEVANCPWKPEHRLLRVSLKGKEMANDKRPPSNFVFLMDVSGSMSPQERLPLIKQSLRMLVKRMTENDRIAIVVYASSSGVVLESTSAVNKEKILEALDRLEAGGSTNGGQGIQRAYALAEEHFIKGGVNRVILCTDGDFNVGITDQSELIHLIQKKAKSGVFLTVLGVGTDNYKDATMQKLADKGNGNYHYLDSVEEAHKVLVQQMSGTLVTIAKDVKVQIEFNPAQVSSYRLIGYEKRILAAEDFNNDKKDAGEIGAGHTVTALYEIVPTGVVRTQTHASVDKLKYQRQATPPATTSSEAKGNTGSKEMLTLKLRYKKPAGDKSILREHVLVDEEKKFSQTSTDFRFAASVASFGMVLKESEHKGRANFGSVLELAREAKGDDKEGYRAEFINLVKKARELQRDE